MTEWKPAINSSAYVEGKLPCRIVDRNERGLWLCDFGHTGKAWLPAELLEPLERREERAA